MNITIAPEDPRSPDAVSLLEELSDCLESITGDSGQSSFQTEDVCIARSLFCIARNDKGEAVGCGAFRPLDGDRAEIKRMYARERSGGVGARLLAYLEERASAMGYTALRLETRRINKSAVAFYVRSGYRQITNYGRYHDRPEAVCFEKHIQPQ